MTKRILALDLATRCGWAIGDGVSAPTYGAWDLSVKSHGSSGARHQAFADLLDFTGAVVSAIAHEIVYGHGKGGTAAAHLFGGWLAAVEAAAHRHNAPLIPLGVGTIKKHATGHGKADKIKMITSANRKWGLSLTAKQHDEADALWILDLALSRRGE